MIKIKCENCPQGCHLKIEDTGYTIKVRGNRCRQGFSYAESHVYTNKNHNGKLSKVVLWAIVIVVALAIGGFYFLK